MIAIIYQWRIKQGLRDQFDTAWSEVTAALKLQGALGSALFEADDGTVFAIARWPDRETRQAAAAKRGAADAFARMIDAIEEELQEHVIEERLNFWT
jgi:heme-degrading monooxygenase HmoA